MKLEFLLEETVKKRKSVRTYSTETISAELKEKINRYISTLSNPFSVKVNFTLLEVDSAPNAKKLGTYGMIKGGKTYFGATSSKELMSLEAIGYEFESLVLYAASLGLGTCWLGGTFNRSEFSKALEIKEDDLFPAVSPLGYPVEKQRLGDSFVRLVAGSDKRKGWDALFFDGDFQNPLSEESAGQYSFPLEMVHLAPSASNKQPWRIVKQEGVYHFYEVKAPGYSERMGYDIQLIDMGIAACHFHLAAIEKDLKGMFRVLPRPKINAPEHTHYNFSWVVESV